MPPSCRSEPRSHVIIFSEFDALFVSFRQVAEDFMKLCRSNASLLESVRVGRDQRICLESRQPILLFQFCPSHWIVVECDLVPVLLLQHQIALSPGCPDGYQLVKDIL